MVPYFLVYDFMHRIKSMIKRFGLVSMHVGCGGNIPIELAYNGIGGSEQKRK